MHVYVWISQDFLYIRLFHLPIERDFLVFKSKWLLFLILVYLSWLEFLVPRGTEVVKSDILVLFLIIGEEHSLFKYYINKYEYIIQCFIRFWEFSSNHRLLCDFIMNVHWILSSVFFFFCFYWDNNVFFILYSSNMMSYTDPNKSRFIVLYMFLNSVVKYFVESYHVNVDKW